MRSDFAAETRQLRGDIRWLLRLMICGFVGTLVRRETGKE